MAAQATGKVLAVFGLSGACGQALASAALERGWRVRGLVRERSAAPGALPGVQVVAGTFDDSRRVAETVAGADAVCCVIGPRPPYTEIFCAQATAAIVQAMRDAGVSRLVCQTGAMIGAGRRSLAFEMLARMLARRQRAGLLDRIEQERLVMASGTDWTLLKPPRLSDAPAGRKLRWGETLEMGLLSSAGRADLARFTLDAIVDPGLSRRRLFVRY